MLEITCCGSNLIVVQDELDMCIIFQDAGEDVTITETSTFSEITETDDSDTDFSPRKVKDKFKESYFSYFGISFCIFIHISIG